MATRAKLRERRFEYWGGVVSDWERSGLTHGKFCRRRKLSVHTLRSWIYKLRNGKRENISAAASTTDRRSAVKPQALKQSASTGYVASGHDGATRSVGRSTQAAAQAYQGGVEKKPEPPIFLPVKLIGSRDDAGLEVILSGGRRITVGREFDAATLRRLMHALESGGC